MAAIRSIKTAKDNHMVMVTQEALAKVRTRYPVCAGGGPAAATWPGDVFLQAPPGVQRVVQRMDAVLDQGQCPPSRRV